MLQATLQGLTEAQPSEALPECDLIASHPELSCLYRDSFMEGH